MAHFRSNENEMEPVLITLGKDGQFKQFEPSLSETFIYVLQGKVELMLRKATIYCFQRRIPLF